ncbi:MAG: TRAP transporter small permease subunit [Synergistales bacterium]|nr:TRAP transporter small permease subunit [Synergistales bacterium]
MGLFDLIEWLNEKIGMIGAWIVIPLNAVVVYEVVIRYVFNNPTDWVYDTAWMLFSAMFLLGGGYTMVHKRHVRIDIIFSALPKRWQAWYDTFFFAVIFLPVMAILTWKGYQFAARAWTSSEYLSTTLWHFPAGPVKTMIPIGFGMLLLQGIVELFRNLRVAVKGEE